jgi:hypothetical protein
LYISLLKLLLNKSNQSDMQNLHVYFEKIKSCIYLSYGQVYKPRRSAKAKGLNTQCDKIDKQISGVQNPL